MKNLSILLTTIAVIIAFTLQAQVAINNDGSLAVGGNSTILDVKDDNGIHSLFIESDGNVGIRNTSPAWMFHMTNGGTSVGVNSIMGLFENNDNGVSLSAWNTSTSNSHATFESATDYLEEAYSVAAIKGIGLGQSLPLSVNTIGVWGTTNEWQGYGVFGTRYNSGGSDSGFGGLFLNDLAYSGGFYFFSDYKAKKDISSINNAIEIIKLLNPVKFYYNTIKYPYLGLKEELDYGFIAQELELILPSIVKEKVLPINGTLEQKKNSNTQTEFEHFKMIDYTRIIPIAIEAIKEQQEIIENLEQRLSELENKVNNQ